MNGGAKMATDSDLFLVLFIAGVCMFLLSLVFSDRKIRFVLGLIYGVLFFLAGFALSEDTHVTKADTSVIQVRQKTLI
jgi:hypothetical protein